MRKGIDFATGWMHMSMTPHKHIVNGNDIASEQVNSDIGR